VVEKQGNTCLINVKGRSPGEDQAGKSFEGREGIVIQASGQQYTSG
jgi:hypothetical protein